MGFVIGIHRTLSTSSYEITVDFWCLHLMEDMMEHPDFVAIFRQISLDLPYLRSPCFVY